MIAVTPRDGSSVSTAEREFTWRSIDADSYRFMLLDDDGTPVWSTDTHDTVLVLPDSIPLTSGRTYFWRVDALQDGITASTGTMRLQVSR